MAATFSPLPPACATQSLGLSNTLISLMVESIISTAQCNLSSPEMWPKDYGPQAVKNGLGNYDFIIIGGGTAGSVLANRLTENPSWTVLVLEAGGDPPAESEVPFMNPTLPSTKVAWGYRGETSPNFGYAYANGIQFASGKMLGGSGSLNGMVYSRGSNKNYDMWEADGNFDWNWEKVLEYFKKSENMLASDILNETGIKNHGISGPMKIDHYDHYEPNPLDQVLIKGMEELDMRNVVDTTGNNHIGFARLAAFVTKGTRLSSAKAFLAAAKERKNLHVIKHAHVTSILTGSNDKIRGVRFAVNGTKQIIAKATKEYILSAGTFNTPQILMLSGIGPRNLLKRLGIKIYRDMKVGENLQDHVLIQYQFRIPHYNSSVKYDVLKEYHEYLKFRNGSFSGPFTADFNAFINTMNSSSPFPNIQMVYVINDERQRELTKYINGFSNSIPQVDQTVTITATILLLNPNSRGRISLRSKNPFEPMNIYANLLDNIEDVKELIKAIRWQQALLRTTTFRNYKIEEVDVSNIPSVTAAPDSDLYWEQYIRHVARAAYHTVGTCKMGPRTDPNSVVTPKLKVHKISNLRIADASVMPYVPSGNTYAPVVMIAERAADFIKEDWGKS